MTTEPVTDEQMAFADAIAVLEGLQDTLRRGHGMPLHFRRNAHRALDQIVALARRVIAPSKDDVERVARAIARQAHVDDGYESPTDKALDYGLWRNHIKQSRAALKALVEV